MQKKIQKERYIHLSIKIADKMKERKKYFNEKEKEKKVRIKNYFSYQ